MKRWLGIVTMASALLAATPAWATTYQIDPKHTTVSFKIRHLLSKVQGWFGDVQGSYAYVPGQPEQWSATATIQATSINTNVADRDTHLRSPDFFDVAQFPTITFTSTGVTDVTPTGAKLNGVLTMHGVERPVTLDVQIHGEAKDPWGKTRSGLTATTTINRKDFGLTWNKALETGQFLVGDEVEIVLEVEGVAQD